LRRSSYTRKCYFDLSCISSSACALPIMDSDTTQTAKLDESLWDSPSKPEGTGKQSKTVKPTYQEQQEHDQALRQELHSVRQVNETIEGVVQSLRKAKDNMQVGQSSLRPFPLYIDLKTTRPSTILSPLLLLYSTRGHGSCLRPSTISASSSTPPGRAPVKT
jgi:hypothetical protein